MMYGWFFLVGGLWAVSVASSPISGCGTTIEASSLPLPLPEVNYTYRSPWDFKTCNHSHRLAYENLEVEIEVSLLQKSLPINLTLNTRGVRSLMNKLRCHEDIHIVVFGGSFTKGAGVFHAPQRGGIAWSGRLNTWLQTAFPHSKIKLHNAAQGSTTSFFAYRGIRQYPPHVDLIIMEYALNDGATPGEPSKKLAYITEAIIRHVYEKLNHTALVYFDVNAITPFEKNAERVHQEVCDTYGVPLVSYRRAIVDEFTACMHRNASLPYSHTEDYCVPLPGHPNMYRFKLWDGDFHPKEPTHRLVAQTMAYYFTQLVELFNSSSSSSGSIIPEPDVVLPAYPIYSLHEHQNISGGLSEDQEGCENPMTLFSSINSDEDSNVTLLKNAFKSYKAEGWTFRTDKLGKPYGWVADSSPKDGSEPTKANNHLVFNMLLVSGSISITYLSTYENSGIFEVYMGVSDYTANGGVGLNRGLPVSILGCCNASHIKRHPNIPKVGVSNSKYIDTLRSDNASRVSEIKVETIHTTYRGGYFVVNIEQIRLSGEEFVRRGGDKVKILGISSC